MKSVSPDSDFCLLPYGPSSRIVEISGEQLTVFIYRPKSRRETKIVLLFDGLKRNAQGIRDKAILLSERTGIIIIAPLMSMARFPKWRYDRAGVFRHQQLLSRKFWIRPLLQSLVEWAKGLISGSSNAKVFMFGHSAGGQMLSRVCAYSALSGVDRFVITNPSSYVAPLINQRAPYGFKNIFSGDQAILQLKTYLATPVTIYLGQEDTGELHLSRSKSAQRQGVNRLQRGRYVFNTGCEVAKEHNFVFNWELIEVPDVGHSSRAMLRAERCCEILSRE